MIVVGMLFACKLMFDLLAAIYFALARADILQMSAAFVISDRDRLMSLLQKAFSSSSSSLDLCCLKVESGLCFSSLAFLWQKQKE